MNRGQYFKCLRSEDFWLFKSPYSLQTFKQPKIETMKTTIKIKKWGKDFMLGLGYYFCLGRPTKTKPEPKPIIEINLKIGISEISPESTVMNKYSYSSN